MKRVILLIAIVAGFGLYSCKKSDAIRYDSRENIWLYLFNADKDSVIYTFADNPGLGKDTLGIPVIIAGLRRDYDRKIKVLIMKDSGTAVAGVHYEPLKEFYILPKNTGYLEIPVVIYNTDPTLDNRAVTIRYKLVPSEDFDVSIPDRINGKFVFSNTLERPSWWGMWFGGYYSRTKHNFFLFVTGLKSLSTDGLDAPKNLYFVSIVTAFMDDPAKWISKNPSKGYKLDLRTDGNYDFYNVNTPTKKTLYKKNTQLNKYFFIDESGEEIH